MSFSITNNAAERIAQLQAKESADMLFRLSVDGGGCSGFQYKLDFDKKQDGDTEFNNGETIVLVDETSMEFIDGAQLDYVESLGFSNFEIKNPNASSSCGCGSSFAI